MALPSCALYFIYSIKGEETSLKLGLIPKKYEEKKNKCIRI